MNLCECLVLDIYCFVSQIPVKMAFISSWPQCVKYADRWMLETGPQSNLIYLNSNGNCFYGIIRVWPNCSRWWFTSVLHFLKHGSTYYDLVNIVTLGQHWMHYFTYKENVSKYLKNNNIWFQTIYIIYVLYDLHSDIVYFGFTRKTLV